MATEAELCDRAAQQPRRAEDIDRHIGVRMRERRHILGLSQLQLARLVGTTHQQTHKYEIGSNRVPAARLHAIARALGVPVDYFFEGYREVAAQALPRQSDRLMLELTRSFLAIPDRREQVALCNLTRDLAEQVA